MASDFRKIVGIPSPSTIAGREYLLQERPLNGKYSATISDVVMVMARHLLSLAGKLAPKWLAFEYNDDAVFVDLCAHF